MQKAISVPKCLQTIKGGYKNRPEQKKKVKKATGETLLAVPASRGQVTSSGVTVGAFPTLIGGANSASLWEGKENKAVGGKE